jgi:hypothetical protein
MAAVKAPRTDPSRLTARPSHGVRHGSHGFLRGFTARSARYCSKVRLQLGALGRRDGSHVKAMASGDGAPERGATRRWTVRQRPCRRKVRPSTHAEGRPIRLADGHPAFESRELGRASVQGASPPITHAPGGRNFSPAQGERFQRRFHLLLAKLRWCGARGLAAPVVVVDARRSRARC